MYLCADIFCYRYLSIWSKPKGFSKNPIVDLTTSMLEGISKLTALWLLYNQKPLIQFTIVLPSSVVLSGSSINALVPFSTSLRITFSEIGQSKGLSRMMFNRVLKNNVYTGEPSEDFTRILSDRAMWEKSRLFLLSVAAIFLMISLERSLNRVKIA